MELKSYSIERTEDYITIAVNGKSLKAYMGKYSLLNELNKRYKALSEDNLNPEERIRRLDSFIELALGKENFSILKEEYEYHEEELYKTIMDFILNTYLPELFNYVKKDSDEKLNQI